MRRSPEYLRLLVLAGLVGIPVAAVAYLFQWVVSELQQWLFSSAPGLLGLDPVPWWWPLPVLAVAGILVGLCIDRLPGAGGHAPAMFIGAAAGVLLADAPGLSLVPAVAMGLAAMCAVMLELPFTSVLLASVLLSTDALQVMPLVIVAVVVANVAAARLPDPRDALRPSAPATA